VGSLLGATQSRHEAVTAGTTAKGDTWWRRWVEFLHNCELDDDIFLRGFTHHERQPLLGAFAHRVRSNEWSKSSRGNDNLVAGTCRAAIDAVCQAFRAAGWEDPGKDTNGNLAFVLQRQMRGYKNNDPAEQPQKAIPFGLLMKMIYRKTKDALRLRFQQLSHMAFFFAMRSCEYLKVQGSRRTQPIRRCDITFRDRFNRIIPHTSEALHTAESVSITFRFQKKDIRDDTITQSRSGNKNFCPVVACATIVRQMLSDGNKATDPVYRFLQENGTFADLSSKAALLLLRHFLREANSESLNIKPEECGLHSLRSSAAMAMYLNGIPVYTIMLLGRWSSDAFLRYICKQVTEFSKGVARKMIQRPVYYHVSHADREDPRAHNRQAATANHGMGNRGNDAVRGAFAVWE
jgi:hypothetical protein